VAQAVRVKPRWQHWYNSARWLAARKGYFAKHPFCADPYGVHGLVLVVARHLDHIVPHLGDYALFWLRSNWQGLCWSCHSRKTATQDGGFGHARQNDSAK